MDQSFPMELRVDITDFRMRYDRTSGPNLLNMSKNHYHKSYEIYCLLAGETHYFIKDKTFHIKAGDIVLINSLDLHRTSLVNDEIRERILVCLNENFINSILGAYGDIDLFSCFKNHIPVLRSNKTHSNAIQAHLYKMLSFYTNTIDKAKKSDELYLKIMSVELLILLDNFSHSVQPEFFQHPSIVHKKISDIVIFINNNYMNEITLDSISSQFNISKYYFVRLFKEIIGLTFIDYLNVIRLKEARSILLKTNFTISRISNEVGYSDASYFCRVFKKYCYCSPAQYKKQRLKELK